MGDKKRQKSVCVCVCTSQALPFPSERRFFTSISLSLSHLRFQDAVCQLPLPKLPQCVEFLHCASAWCMHLDARISMRPPRALYLTPHLKKPRVSPIFSSDSANNLTAKAFQQAQRFLGIMASLRTSIGQLAIKCRLSCRA